MNYGYNAQCPNWKEDRKFALAVKLEDLVMGYKDKYKMKPYVEIEGLYNGIRIRRITHLTDEQQDQLVKEADKIYDYIMK